jgi:dipeptidyl aminopeptidase/acylaminoacyl peptidase
MAQKFDVATFALAGEPFQIAEYGGAQFFRNPFSASANGGVAYLARPDTQTELQWFDRSGTPLGVAGPRDDYNSPELSPDENRIGFDIATNGNYDIWTLDIATAIKSRVTTNKAADYQPLWSPDGRTIGFTSYRSGIGNLYRREIDVVADDTLIQESTIEQRVSDWARDDSYLVYEQDQPTSGDQQAAADIWAVSLRGPPDPIRITNTPFNERNPRLSPDARSIAYESNESEQVEVYVQSFPQPRARQRVSAGGGRNPRWKPDGTELYYLTDDGALMARSVNTAGDALRLGPPSRLFRANVSFVGGPGRVLNVARDGRFLLNVVPAHRRRSSYCTTGRTPSANAPRDVAYESAPPSARRSSAARRDPRRRAC